MTFVNSAVLLIQKLLTGPLYTQVAKALVEKVLASPTQKTRLVEAKEVLHTIFALVQ